mmetsp:Transcript_3912/g.7904  ORF Transcript_3912/g.7904 Transcript_3912/m.7904 type:complete len:898 (-) Transcript_3912:181-2874(-)
MLQLWLKGVPPAQYQPCCFMKSPVGHLPLDSISGESSSSTRPSARSDLGLELATVGAWKLLRRSAIVGAAATLLGGAGALPLTGSACCRKGLLVVNASIWGGSALAVMVCLCWLPHDAGGPTEYQSVPVAAAESTAPSTTSRGTAEQHGSGSMISIDSKPTGFARTRSPITGEQSSFATPSTPRREEEDSLGPLPGLGSSRSRLRMAKAKFSPRKDHGRSTPSDPMASEVSEASFDTSSTLTLGAPLGRTLNTLEIAIERAREQARQNGGAQRSPNLPEFGASWRLSKFLEVVFWKSSNSPLCYMVSCVGAILVVCVASTVLALLWKEKTVRSHASRQVGSHSFSPVMRVQDSTTPRSPRDQKLVACTGLSCKWALRVIKWKVHEWGPCTNKCGSGVVRREVECRSGTVAYCRLRGQEPARWKECQQYDGCFWEVGNWSLCSNACGFGSQHREVHCPSKVRDDCLYHGGEPQSKRQCKETIGCSWDLGSWGACSSKCGNGEQRRVMHCKGNPGITAAIGLATGSSATGLATGSSTLPPSDHSSKLSWLHQQGAATDGKVPGLAGHSANTDIVPPNGQNYGNMGVSGGDQAAEMYRGTVGRRLTRGCVSLPADQVSRWTVRSCVGVGGCRWRALDWGSCTGTCSLATRTRNISCADGSIADCKRFGAFPERTSRCTPSGCNAGAKWFGCTCVPGDIGETVLAMAGALNALSGWTTACMMWLMLAARLPRSSCTGNPKAVALMPLASILFAGISAFLASLALGCSPAGCASRARGIVINSGQFTVGLEGLAVWLVMLPSAQAQMQNSISCIVLWACAGFVLLGLVAMALHDSMGTTLAVGAEQLYRFCWAKKWPLLLTILLICLVVSALRCAYTNLGLKTRFSTIKALEDRIHRVLRLW